MKQSKNDPTLRSHFTEEEARQWIRHLERVIERLEAKDKKRLELQSKLTYYRRKYRRFFARVEFLQEEHPEIDFGLDDFRQQFFKEQED